MEKVIRVLQNKKIFLTLLGIVLIIVGAYIASSLIYQEKDNKIEEVKEEKPLTIGEEIVNLKLYRINQSFFLEVPSTFKKLDEDQLKQQYKDINRPELVFTSSDNSHIFISIVKDNKSEDDLVAIIAQKKEELGSDCLIEKEETYDKYQKKFGRLAFFNQITKTYHDIRYFILDQKLVTVEFNTTEDLKDDYLSVSEYILDRICFTEEDTKE